MTQIDTVLIDLQRSNKCNYLPFLLQSDLKKKKQQVPILLYKAFWYQELSNQVQLNYET